MKKIYFIKNLREDNYNLIGTYISGVIYFDAYRFDKDSFLCDCSGDRKIFYHPLLASEAIKDIIAYRHNKKMELVIIKKIIKESKISYKQARKNCLII